MLTKNTMEELLMNTKALMAAFVAKQLSISDFRRKLEDLLQMNLADAKSKIWLTRFISAHFMGQQYRLLYETIQQF